LPCFSIQGTEKCLHETLLQHKKPVPASFDPAPLKMVSAPRALG
jgi:hypothetical protein